MSENVNGWLNVLKEEGQTSFSVSKSLKKKFKFKKLGHLGTLDPLAKGVLPIAIGEATKTINYINNNIKRYSFTIKWGEETNTCDREGEVLSESKIRPTSKDINIIVNKFFIGKIYQVPPIFSAVKVNGVRAYSLARKKIEVKLKKKQIEIFKLEVESPQKKDFCKFDIVCGSGTYIRSLARDIAKKLGTVGYAYEIIRTEDNMFKIQDSYSLDYILNLDLNEFKNLLLPVDCVLLDKEEIVLEKKYSEMLKNGIIIQANKVKHNFKRENKLLLIKDGDKLVTIAYLEKEFIIPRRNFNL